MQGDLAEVAVVLHQFKLIRSVLLVFCGHNVMLIIFRAHQPDDFALFAFLFCHGKPLWFDPAGRASRRVIMAGPGFCWQGPAERNGPLPCIICANLARVAEW